MTTAAKSRRDEILDLLKRAGVKPADALKQLNDELARESLIDFGKLVYAGFQDPAHVHFLANLLERAERGEIRKLAISAPPGHGKSTLLQAFCAWFLGRDPRRRELAVSASESLAQRNSRVVRGMVQSPEWPWPGTKLVGQSLEEWHTPQGGGARTIGQTGTVTGFRAELILCDDVQPDAGTESSRVSLEEWFRGILTTRLEPDGIVVIINTRWHDADIIGRLQDGPDADEWTFVNLPAVAVENDPLGRAEGEALWPSRWSVDKLASIRRTIFDGPFAAQYQGDPVPVGGALFKPQWLEHTYTELPTSCVVSQVVDQRDPLAIALAPLSGARPLPLIVVQAIDSAWKTGAHNDRSVIATLFSDMRDVYIADIWADRVAYTDLKRIAEEKFDQYKPRAIYVEEAASGYALVDELKRAPGKIIPVIPVKPGHDDKVARAEAETGWFEAGRIKLPQSAPWLGTLKHEFLRFPHGAHDDIVDAVVLGVSQIRLTIARMQIQRRRNRSHSVDTEGFMGR